MAEKMIVWLNMEPFLECLGSKIEEMDFSIVCQYSKKQVVHPSRSSSCEVACVVELATLKETMTCSCGREIDEENPMVEDQTMKDIVEFIRNKYGDKVTTVRINFKEKTFWPIS